MKRNEGVEKVKMDEEGTEGPRGCWDAKLLWAGEREKQGVLESEVGYLPRVQTHTLLWGAGGSTRTQEIQPRAPGLSSSVCSWVTLHRAVWWGVQFHWTVHTSQRSHPALVSAIRIFLLYFHELLFHHIFMLLSLINLFCFTCYLVLSFSINQNK